VGKILKSDAFGNAFWELVRNPEGVVSEKAVVGKDLEDLAKRCVSESVFIAEDAEIVTAGSVSTKLKLDYVNEPLDARDLREFTEFYKEALKNPEKP